MLLAQPCSSTINQQASLHLHNTTISGHMGAQGVGVYTADRSTARISNSTFSEMSTHGAVMSRNLAHISIENQYFPQHV
jgi:hypothetical protein